MHIHNLFLYFLSLRFKIHDFLHPLKVIFKNNRNHISSKLENLLKLNRQSILCLKILFFYLSFQVKKSYPMIKETGLNALLQKPKISKSNMTQFLDASVPWDLRKILVIFGMTPGARWSKWPLLTSKEASSIELLGKQNIKII